MAGGGTTTSNEPGGRRSVDHALNMVPFIDLLSVLITFLLMTSVWSQVAKGTSEFFLTQDLQFNRVLQNRALEQAGRFVAEDLASRFLLFLETGELDKMLKRPVKAEALPGGNAPPEPAR